jgi:hypothetical protein
LRAKKPVFSGLCFLYRRCAPLKENLGALLSALHVLRLIVQTTIAETAFGCPQTTPQGFMRCAASGVLAFGEKPFYNECITSLVM